MFLKVRYTLIQHFVPDLSSILLSLNVLMYTDVIPLKPCHPDNATSAPSSINRDLKLTHCLDLLQWSFLQSLQILFHHDELLSFSSEVLRHLPQFRIYFLFALSFLYQSSCHPHWLPLVLQTAYWYQMPRYFFLFTPSVLFSHFTTFQKLQISQFLVFSFFNYINVKTRSE